MCVLRVCWYACVRACERQGRAIYDENMLQHEWIREVWGMRWGCILT